MTYAKGTTVSIERSLLRPPEPPHRYLPEAAMIDMLARRHTVIDTRRPSQPHRYGYADHVPDAPFDGRRICDFMAIDCHGSFGPYEHRHPLHGFEVKASRADWLTELRSPDKAETFKRHCHRWWLVVSDPRIVRDGELPADWGLLTVTGNRLKQVKAAPKLTPEPMPWPMVAAFTRAVAKTARRVSAGAECPASPQRPPQTFLALQSGES